MSENENRKVLLSLKNVSVKFNVRGRILTAIRNVSLDIYEHESIAIVGESGSGKSVLTKTFAGMLESNGFISEGSVIFSDDDLSHTNVKLTPANLRLLERLTNKYNKYSVLERGAGEYRAIRQKKADIAHVKTLTEEEEESFRTRAKDIHDDIVDEAPFRRDRESVQRRFGKDAAVYAGDYLIARVQYYQAQENLHEAGMLLADAIQQMCAGEIGQARCRYREDVTMQEYLCNIRGKTTALFRASCRIGALESGCSKEVIEQLDRLGESLGCMFQFRDDLLDFTTDKEVLGKETHKDFRDGIYTMPVLMAMRRSKKWKPLYTSTAA